MHPEFDARDQQLLTDRIANRLSLPGPLVGDFVIMQDGKTRRFTHDWGDTIQTSIFENGGSFYLEKSGYGNYSGGLEPGVAKKDLQNTGDSRMGDFWFFHHGYSAAANGVNVKVPCKVYRVNGRPE